jgi:chromosome segregation ATPase
MMWNPFSSPFSKSPTVTFADVQSKIKSWISADSDDFNEVWKKFSAHMKDMDRIQAENLTLKAQLDLTELECNDAVGSTTRLNLEIQILEEKVVQLAASRDEALSENARLQEAITSKDLKNAMIPPLEAELSLRNDELDEAFVQITNLTNELQAKEEETVIIIKELEFAKEELVGEKNALKFAMEQNASISSSIDDQIQRVKSETELAMHDHIIGLQTERDDLLGKNSSLISEKGIFSSFDNKKVYALRQKRRFVNLMPNSP